MKRLLVLALFALFPVIAFAAQKADTLVVSTRPQMHCVNCENKIKQNIRFVKGTKNIITSRPDQTVTIIYDGKKAKYEDFVTAFKKIGYEIKRVER
ncbi:MAG: heavy-metal-associated domain-containing protein [Candidatus Cryptobacteroides sp.]